MVSRRTFLRASTVPAQTSPSIRQAPKLDKKIMNLKGHEQQRRQTPIHDPLPTLNAPSAKHLDGLGLPSHAEPELRLWTMIEEDRLKQQELDLLRDVQHAKRLGFDERDPKSGVPSAVSELQKELERTKDQRNNSILDHFNVFTVISDNLDPLYYLESSLARLLNQRLPIIDRRCKFPREPVDHDQIYALLSEWQEDQIVFFGKEEH
ncbi:hypothetical protein NLU13_0207 [Sarocladium strictum]|uniref:Uncharacterized protein n=1 Tax=Sarocladium strictum TaxID=5046 RepID=A0AA39GPE9_SARSR|nr:hypothetical protein NLU13_0207 [Sarocladium strictum]